MKYSEEVKYCESHKIGEGLPFSIIKHGELMRTSELFKPTLRDFHVIFWLKKGTGKYYIDFEGHEIKPNTVLLTSKDNLHYFEPFSEDCELQSITFQPNFIYRNDTDLRHLFTFNPLCHFVGKHTLFPNEKETRFLERLSEQMFDIYNSWEGKEREDAFYHSLCMFLLRCEHIKTAATIAHKPGEVNNSEMLLEFNELLSLNFKKEHKVDFYVKKLGTTVKTLSRLVKEQNNISTKALIDERRTLEIKRMLRGTSKPVKEIAYELGFDEPTNMIKYFKKHVGMTPNGFRKSFV